MSQSIHTPGAKKISPVPFLAALIISLIGFISLFLFAGQSTNGNTDSLGDDASSFVTIIVFLKDQQGNPLAGEEVKIRQELTEAEDVETISTGFKMSETDEDGKASFEVIKKGSVSFLYKDQQLGETLHKLEDAITTEYTVNIDVSDELTSP